MAGTLLLALFVLLYIATLGIRPLFIPDETRYGEIAREMLATGDWIVPRLNGLLYFEKPPFGYWLNALSISIFGETPFAVRFSSSLATAAAAITVFIAGKQLFRSRTIPYLATFIFLTTLEVQVIGNFSVLDPAFAVVLNGGILSMALGAYAVGRKRIWLLVLAGLLFGLAFLTKGFLAFALPFLVLTPWLLIRRDYKFLIRHAWIVVAVALLTVAPWAVAIHTREPDFWNYFFWVEHIQRFASENAQHKQPFYFFLMLLPALAFPWVFLLPTAVKNLRDSNSLAASDGAILLLTLWACVPFVFFSIASGKLSTYILPCFVPFSVLMAVGIASAMSEIRKFNVSLGFAALAVLVFFVALVVFVGKGEDLAFLPDEWAKKAALYASLSVATLSLAAAAFMRRPEVRLACVGLSMIPFMIALPISMPETVLGLKAPEQFLSETFSKLPKDSVIVTNGSLVRAMSWSTKRDDIYVIENGGETTYGLQAPDGKERFLEPAQLSQLLRTNANALIVCKGQCSTATVAVLPGNAIRSSYGNFFAYTILAQPGSSKSAVAVPRL
jgi:4-amino-4-deoxy-L-arabinose transferase